MTIQSINPANGTLIRSYSVMTWEETLQILEEVQKAFLSWRPTSFSDRSDKMNEVANVLLSRKEEFARLIAQEMGKPVGQGRSEIEKCASGCEFYAHNAQKFLQPESIPTEAAKSYVSFPPLGIILAIMPWNFPFWQVFRFAAPALMAGNAAVLKHASNVPGCALAIEEVFREAKIPEHLFRTLFINLPDVDKLIAHPLIKAVTLTGSTPAGKAVARKAGECLKKTVLELGGSDPYVIFSDADLDLAASVCASSRMVNGGQSCIAAKRFIVPRSIQKEFENKFVTKMKIWIGGDPLDDKTNLGPLARADLRDGLHKQVQESLKKGAKLLLGGTMDPGPGAYYQPTVLTNVKKGMPAYDEELFGPVASIIPVEDEPEAIRVANDTPFGLGAAVFTRDPKRGEETAQKELEAGSCFVNDFVRSDPRLPFGGIKESGYGRELGIFGIREFVNIKTVYVAKETKLENKASVSE